MVTYYLGPSAHITERILRVRLPDRYLSYDLRDLADVRCGRSGPDATGVRYGAVCGLAALLAVVAGRYLHSVQEWVITAAVVAAPGVLSVVCLRTRPPQWTLYARYRGRRVRLYTSSDLEQFNAVKGGLLRALERGR
jgi:hypothetical protein